MPTAASSLTPTTVQIDGRTLDAFAGCNYLGLSQHPDVHHALRRGLSEYGISSSASRETSGNTVAHVELEQAISAFLNTEQTVLVLDGYTANVATAQALRPSRPIALIDERAHRSLFDAAQTAGMRVETYAHLDAANARDRVAKLRNHDPRIGIAVLTDGVFCSDGARAPVDDLLDALPTDAVNLVVDDCHGFTVLENGRGSAAHHADDPRLVITTTLAKGLGTSGGVIASSATTIAQARSATAYVCITPPPPAMAMAAHAALQIVQNEPDRLHRLRHNAGRLHTLLREVAIDVASPPEVPIAAFAAPTHEAGHLERSLTDQAILLPQIEYPGGPAPTYFRASVTSEHTETQLQRLAGALRDGLGTDSPIGTVRNLTGNRTAQARA